MKKNKKLTIEDLARMTQGGFLEAAKQMKEGFAQINGKFDQANERFDRINNNIRILSENNTHEHEDIKLRLDGVAYRFELVSLEKRVKILEDKMEK